MIKEHTTILFHSMYLYIINILLLLKCNTTLSPSSPLSKYVVSGQYELQNIIYK